jgi:squalene-hopene/tetraprenyl-beta-curcumene cyclase
VPAASSRREFSTPLATSPAPDATQIRSAIDRGLAWLAAHQNPDGGWGDTTQSLSNISTTALCWAAFGAVSGAESRWREVVRRAEMWMGKVISNQCSVISDPSAANATATHAAPTDHCSLITDYSSSHPTPLHRDTLARTITARYGKDRTFSVPILTMCALAGRFGEGRDAWRNVIQLPFELATVPQKFFAAMRLPVVSYALPALIAIGQVRHHHRPTRNPLLRVVRDRARAWTLRVLETIQPGNGGFLEATPLTSFVTMSLVGCGHGDHIVARRGVDFLLKSARADGSWPIDTNLATWVTTLAVNALGARIHDVISEADRARILDWLLAQQYRAVHPYTGAAPGGWAWTDLPGGVPDADDTAGALLALKNLSLAPGSSRGDARDDDNTRLKPGANEKADNPLNLRVRTAAIAGVTWLLDLQNRDGGIPTFCRGWTNLPFDRSSPDITAHAVRAWLAWKDSLPADLQSRALAATRGATNYLATSQRGDGAWLPLWFGNQHHADESNPDYGTAKGSKALTTLNTFAATRTPLVERIGAAALAWLGKNQQPDSGWGRATHQKSSIEETALAVEALANAARVGLLENREPLARGTQWLIERVEDGSWTQPAPIGFYFAKLWYYERLYPVILTVAALEAVARLDAPLDRR